MVIHTSFADFVLFLFVHLSHVDNNYDPSELAAIKSKMAHLYKDSVNFEKKLYLTIREYNTFDKSKLNELIKDSFVHFHPDQQEQKNRLFTDMHEIVNADGNVNPSETQALEMLKQIIDLTP